MGLVVTRYDTACRRRISYSQAVRAGDYFIFKLKFLLYGHVMNILIGYGLLMLHEGSTLNFFKLKYILLQPLDI